MNRLAFLLALPLLLGGCGSTVGGFGGLTTAGSATVQVQHKAGGGCPDVMASGAIPIMGLELGCIYDPASGRTSETAKLQSSDPGAILAANNALLAGLLTQAIGIGKAVGTGGMAMSPGSATAMPFPGVAPGPRPLTPPTP